MAISATPPNQRGIFSFVRQIRPPKLGELRDPVSLYKSTLTPIKAADGSPGYQFRDTITPYYNCWAKVFNFQGAYLDGQNTENNLSTIFLIRNFEGLVIEINTFVLWKKHTFVVRGIRGVEDATTIMKDGYNFMLMLCDEYGIFKEEERDDSKTGAPEATSQDENNPLWR